MNVDIRAGGRPLNIISLCTGGGGLDRAVELAIPTARPVLCVERESFSAANLVAQMQQRVMAEAPVWSDVRTVPGRRFRGAVDGVIGGIPCQPYSLAGKRLGREDERDLWGPARRIFVASGAWFILIENVGGMLSEGGAERVRRDLLRLGCKVEGGLFRASEIGASHERERLFILGVADRHGEHGHRRGVFRPGWRGQPTDGGSCIRPGVGLADPSREGLQGRGPDGDRPGKCATAERGGGALADAHELELRGQPSARQQLFVQQDDGTCLGVDQVNPEGVGRGEGRPEPEFRSGWRSAGGADGQLADADCPRPAPERGDAGEVGGLQEAEREPEHGSALSGGSGAAVADAGRLSDQRRGVAGELPRSPGAAEGEPQERQRRGDAADGRLGAMDDAAGPRRGAGQSRSGRALRDQARRAGPDRPSDGLEHPLGGGRDGGPQEPQWSPEERAAVEWASRGPLFAPGPADAGTWGQIAERYPERLPALSRHDLFRVEIGKARAAAYGLAASGSCKAWGNSPPETWVDQGGPYGLRAAIVQEIAQSTLRRGSDGVAARIDELRMLGNGVVDLEGAYALRTLATDLARRSAGAAFLVRLMGERA